CFCLDAQGQQASTLPPCCRTPEIIARRQLGCFRRALSMISFREHELSDDERNLLRHYAEGERVVSRLQRMPAHRHLLRIGYTQEQRMSGRDVLIAVTDASVVEA